MLNLSFLMQFQITNICLVSIGILRQTKNYKQTNSGDQDQTASDYGLHCLPCHQGFYETNMKKKICKKKKKVWNNVTKFKDIYMHCI